MRDYERAYDEQLSAFRLQRENNEEAGYTDEVKIYVASLISVGENSQHIAEMLNITKPTVIEWYRNLFLNQEDLVFGMEDFTYIRDMNKIRPDGRTKGCIVKAVLEETLTIEAAAEAVGLGCTPRLINNWINTYRRDYDFMTTMPAYTELIIRSPYASRREDAEEVQAIIYEHDRVENHLASARREQDRIRRA